MLGPTTSMQIDLPCIQIQALKSKILNLSFLAVHYPSLSNRGVLVKRGALFQEGHYFF